MKYFFFVLVSVAYLLSCDNSSSKNTVRQLEPVAVVNQTTPFSDYWDKGRAEITTYVLKQARYGELHEGIANTIFVTEPFSKSKQVKLDNASSRPSDNLPVLKMNFTRKFFTGVYPYSTMLSVFTPTEQKQNPNSVKAVFGAQEWCGQTFTQLNLSPSGYNMEEFSYFESEGDKSTKLDKVLLEDEIWNMLRINPLSLPIGEVKIIPGLTFTRLSHVSAEATTAKATLSENGKTNTHSLFYPSFNRTLIITFDADFPHQISSWEEKGYSGFGAGKKLLSTTASIKSRKMIDYWNKNGIRDSGLREELGLE